MQSNNQSPFLLYTAQFYAQAVHASISSTQKAMHMHASRAAVCSFTLPAAYACVPTPVRACVSMSRSDASACCSSRASAARRSQSSSCRDNSAVAERLLRLYDASSRAAALVSVTSASLGSLSLCVNTCASRQAGRQAGKWRIVDWEHCSGMLVGEYSKQQCVTLMPG
jgi:hypothetical protein